MPYEEMFSDPDVAYTSVIRRAHREGISTYMSLNAEACRDQDNNLPE
jgi:hypothetical protein